MVALTKSFLRLWLLQEAWVKLNLKAWVKVVFCDQTRNASENSLRNEMSYFIEALSEHFKVSKVLEPWIFDELSEDAMHAENLVQNLSSASKVRPVLSDQILGNDDTSLFVRTGATNDKKNGTFWIPKH